MIQEINCITKMYAASQLRKLAKDVELGLIDVSRIIVTSKLPGVPVAEIDTIDV